LIVIGVRNHAQEPHRNGIAVLVPVTDSGRDEYTVAWSDFHLARIEAQNHGAFENDLLVFDVVVTVAWNAASGLKGELTGDKIRDPALRTEQNLQRSTSAARDGDGFYGIQGPDDSGGWMTHGDLLGRLDCNPSRCNVGRSSDFMRCAG
jgi:hypothetical protein